MHRARRWRRRWWRWGGGEGGGGGGEGGGGAAGNSRISRQYRDRYEYDTAAGHRTRITLVQLPAVNHLPPSLSCSSLVVGWLYATRAWRALVLFSACAGPLLTRSCLSFRLSFHCRCCLSPAATLTLSLSDRESRPIKRGEIGSRARDRGCGRANNGARYGRIRALLHTADRRYMFGKNVQYIYVYIYMYVARGRKTYGCRRLVLTRLVAQPKMDIACRSRSQFAANVFAS